MNLRLSNFNSTDRVKMKNELLVFQKMMFDESKLPGICIHLFEIYVNSFASRSKLKAKRSLIMAEASI